MPAPSLTRAQWENLRAASRGEITTVGPGQTYDWGTWRIGHAGGRAVTTSVTVLIRRGWARPATEPDDEGRIPLDVTAEGNTELSKWAARRAH